MAGLKTDSDQMFAAAAKLAAMYANSDEQFRSGHQQIIGALAEGWVGRSAQTMTEVLGRWQTSADGISARVISHSGGISNASRQLTVQDDTEADSIATSSDAALNL